VGTMDVFISWSGERSRAAAEALRGWLPKIINAIKPWLSSADIAQGARWSADVATRLESARAGINCLTQDNLHADWILFEAGALSKTLQNTYVCPFLIDLEPSDVNPPLAQFQATRARKDDVLKLLKTLNSALGDSALPNNHIEEAFEVWWPKLDSQLEALPTEVSKTKTHRSDRELLEEVLALVRDQSRSPQTFPPESRDTTILKAARSVHPSITRMTSYGGGDYGLAEREGGTDLRITVPNSIPLSDIDACVRSQLPPPWSPLFPAKSKKKQPTSSSE
jgi:hypothetical protein